METENKLIAEFMEWVIEPGMENLKNPYYNYAHGWKMILLSQMQFNTSWDWLMPVVEKIENKVTGCVVTINSGHGYSECVITDNFENSLYISRANDDTLLETVYNAVIQFIKWYNKQQLTQITNP